MGKLFINSLWHLNIILPFPFTNQSGSKYRPAVVVSNNIINTSKDLIAAQITTKTLSGPYAMKISNADVLIPFKPPHSEMYISCKKIAVFEKSIVQKKITELSDSRITELIDKVKSVFDKD